MAVRETIDKIAGVVALAIGAGIVTPYVSTGGALEDQAQNWSHFKGVYFASMILKTLMEIA